MQETYVVLLRFVFSFNLLEPFVEAVPQVFVLTCISALSGTGSRRTYSCADQNCGIVGQPHYPASDPVFFATYLLRLGSSVYVSGRLISMAV
jgi:hypothetical protein